MSRQDQAEIKRIVVRTPNWVGDAVMSLPALHQLRQLFRSADITLVAPPGTADIFIDADFADSVLKARRGISGVITGAREWKAGRFDLAVLLQNAFAAAMTAFLARVPVRIGYDTDRRGALLTTAVPLPDWRHERHESFYYLNIVTELERLAFGTSSIATTAPRFDLRVSDERKKSVRVILDQAGTPLNKPLAVLCPGSVNSRAKRWPVERYAELADRLIESGMTVVLIGSPGEIGVTNELMARVKCQPIALTGKTSVAQAAAIISIADVLVTNDTGPAHLGAALNTPTLVIFGPTNPLTTYPFSEAGQIIRHPPDCAPCMLRDCPIDHRCMTAITPQEVFEHVTRLMKARASQVFG